jgi:hypothetical protein
VPFGKLAQVSGVQTGGLTHEVRSKSMNSRSFSCGVIEPGVVPLHAVGNVSPVLGSFEASSTWKSLKTPRPHAVPPTGVSNV